MTLLKTNGPYFTLILHIWILVLKNHSATVSISMLHEKGWMTTQVPQEWDLHSSEAATQTPFAPEKFGSHPESSQLSLLFIQFQSSVGEQKKPCNLSDQSHCVNREYSQSEPFIHHPKQLKLIVFWSINDLLNNREQWTNSRTSSPPHRQLRARKMGSICWMSHWELCPAFILVVPIADLIDTFSFL